MGPAEPGRRAVALALGAALMLPGAGRAQAQASTGLVLPRQTVPDVPLTDAEGRRAGLAGRLRGRVSAVQLMFAGCSTVCPLQGALFAGAARRVQAAGVQLLSLSVDPLSDGPAALGAWLDRFGRHLAWSAAAPRVEDVESLAGFLLGAPPKTGTHSSRVFLFDREARLAFRTVDMPAAVHVAGLLEQLACA